MPMHNITLDMKDVKGKWCFSLHISVPILIVFVSSFIFLLSDFSIAEKLHWLRQSLWTYKLSLNAYVKEWCFLCSHSYSQGQRRCLHHWVVAVATDRTVRKERVCRVGVWSPWKIKWKQKQKRNRICTVISYVCIFLLRCFHILFESPLANADAQML